MYAATRTAGTQIRSSIATVSSVRSLCIKVGTSLFSTFSIAGAFSGCYGIVNVPEGSWYCSRCAASASDARCILCPQPGEMLMRCKNTQIMYSHAGGALKRVSTGGWAHVVCALYIPEVEFGDVHTMEPVIVDKLPEWRYQQVCCLCERSQVGACTQCNRHGCKKFFHVTCAQKLSLLREEGVGTQNVKYCGYCPAHVRRDSTAQQRAVTPPATAPNGEPPVAHQNGPMLAPLVSSTSATTTTNATPAAEAPSNGAPTSKPLHKPGDLLIFCPFLHSLLIRQARETAWK